MGNTKINTISSLSRLLEKEIDPFFVFDQGQILYANNTLTTLLGCEESRLHHHTFIKNILTVGETGLFRQHADRIINRQSTFQLFDVPIQNEQPSPARCDISISPISWHGKHTHVCLIKSKPVSSNSEHSPDHKLKVIGSMYAGIIHDINNIMASLIGFSELALEETRSMEKAQSYLNEIMTAAQRAKELINKVLWIENKTTPQKTDIVPIINSVVKLLNVTYPQKTSVTYMGDPQRVTMDGSDFFQLILNLCLNAHQATEKQNGDIHLIVDLQKIIQQSVENPWYAHHGDYLLIEITDKGLGMDQLTMNYMFDLCFTANKNGQGTGIGLVIVKSIIRKYKGFLYLESHPVEGTRFKVYLPL